jgi:hypothetical protein
MKSICRLLLSLSIAAAGQATAGIVALGDVNGNGSQDIAVLSHGTNTALVKDTATGALIQTVRFNDDNVWEQLVLVPDANGNGAPELAVLRRGSSHTEMRDSLTGQLISMVQFDPVYAHAYRDVAVIEDQNGVPGLALVGKQANGDQRVVVESRNAVSGTLLADTFFNSGCHPAKLLALPDSDGNALPNFAVLCVNPLYVKVEVRDMSGALLRGIYVDRAPEYLQMGLLAATNGSRNSRLALLRYKPAIDVTQVVIVDVLAGTSRVAVSSFGGTFQPRHFAVMPDLNGNGSEELALVRSDPEPGADKVQIRDTATGALVKEIWFDKRFLPQDVAVIPDSNGNGVVELASLGIRVNTGARRVAIKDARSSVSLGIVDLDHALTGLKTLDAGDGHTCAVKTGGTVECWGSNENWGESTAPGLRFTQISAGGASNCGLGIDGSITCWGNYIGDPPAGTFVQISVGGSIDCAIRADGTVKCWGGAYPPVPPPGTFKQVSVGGYSICFLQTDNHVLCTGDELTPPADTFSEISTGGNHACGVRTDGRIACWGRNDFGEGIAPGGTFRHVSAGGYYNCAVRTDSSVACWGRNDAGQASPPAGGSFSLVTANGAHTCGLRLDGTVSCWGSNAYGQTTPGWVDQW